MSELTLDEILGKDSLDEDDLDFLLATQKQRGVFKPVVERFIESEDMYLNLSDMFPGREAASLKSSVNIRIKQDFPNAELRLLIVGKKGDKQAVLLVNMPVYLAAKAAKAAAEHQEDEEVL